MINVENTEFDYEMAYESDPNEWAPISEQELRDLLGTSLADRVIAGETITKDTVMYRHQEQEKNHENIC